jgi:hypothetical protein
MRRLLLSLATALLGLAIVSPASADEHKDYFKRLKKWQKREREFFRQQQKREEKFYREQQKRYWEYLKKAGKHGFEYRGYDYPPYYPGALPRYLDRDCDED